MNIHPTIAWTLVSDPGNEDPDRIINTYNGLIAGNCPDTGDRAQIGTCSVICVDTARATNTGVSVFEAMDCHSAELNAMHGVVYADHDGYGFEGEFREDLKPIIGEHELYGLMVIDRMRLKQAFRNKNLGAYLINHIMDTLGCGMSVVAINAYPLQFEGSQRSGMTRDDDNLTLEQAQDKLMAHYAKVGFQSLPWNKGCMALSTAYARTPAHCAAA